jgi:hypothetical protein
LRNRMIPASKFVLLGVPILKTRFNTASYGLVETQMEE